MSLFRSRKTLLSLAAAAMLGPAAFAAHAQAYTPQEFARACESSPGNAVLLSEPLKLQGRFSGDTQVIATGCTVTLATDAAFELDQITLSFGGPLVVRGNRNGKVQIEKAVINAPSVALTLTGSDSQFQMKEGRVVALTGDLAMQFGSNGKLEIVDSGGWNRGGLTAAGALRIASGQVFEGKLTNAGMEGAGGISLAMNGADSKWTIEKSTLNLSNFNFADASPYRAGPLSITSSALKAFVEISETNIRFASRAIDMRLGGAESTLLLKGVTSQTASETIYLGASGYKGVVLIESPVFYGNPDIVVQSGTEGSTAVIGNAGLLSAQRSVRVSAGAGGSCTVTPAYTLSAPQVSACR